MVEPDPVALALLAERAGADGITVHLREDRRHIQESDVRRLRESIQTRLNLEMACTEDMVQYAIALKPETVCLVPESREEVTTEGGLDVAGQKDRVGAVIDTMHQAGIATSLFIDPSPDQVTVSAALKTDFIELHTGAYANAYYSPDKGTAFGALKQAVQQAHDLGLTVNGGHGISYVNVSELCTIEGWHEFNIGHSILSRALFTGIEEAVREMKARIIV